MKTNNFLFLVLTFILSVGGIDIAAGQDQSGPKGRKALSPPVELTVGVIGSASDVGFFVAQDRGYFKAEGLTVKFKYIAGFTKMLPALATGELDVASGGISASLVNAVKRGIALRLVADKGTLVPGFGYLSLVVRKEIASKIKTPKDMKGLRIATNGYPGSVDVIVIKGLLEQGGLTKSDVRMVTLRFPEMISALSSGSVDVALAIEPFATRAVSQGYGVRWKGADAFAPNTQLAGVFYGPNLIKNKPEVARRFMVAYVRAIRDYNAEFLSGKNPDAIISILTKYTRMKDPKAYKQIVAPAIGVNAEINSGTLTALLNAWKEHKLVPQDAKVGSIVDEEYLKYAWDVLGKR